MMNVAINNNYVCPLCQWVGHHHEVFCVVKKIESADLLSKYYTLVHEMNKLSVKKTPSKSTPYIASSFQLIDDDEKITMMKKTAFVVNEPNINFDSYFSDTAKGVSLILFNTTCDAVLMEWSGKFIGFPGRAVKPNTLLWESLCTHMYNEGLEINDLIRPIDVVMNGSTAMFICQLVLDDVWTSSISTAKLDFPTTIPTVGCARLKRSAFLPVDMIKARKYKEFEIKGARNVVDALTKF